MFAYLKYVKGVAVAGVRAAQKQRTRDGLIAQGRRLFAARGYAEVGLAEVAAAAGVTKGALYHQFAGKVELFEAVLAQVQQEVGEQVAAAAEAHAAPWDQFVAGCLTFLRASIDPAAARIMLVDGPAALGWHSWRELDDATSGRHLAEAVTDLIGRGLLPPGPPDALTRLLSGAMNEAALWAATHTEPDAAVRAEQALTTLLTGLRTLTDHAPPPPPE